MDETRIQLKSMHNTLRWLLGGLMVFSVLNLVLTVAILQLLTGSP